MHRVWTHTPTISRFQCSGGATSLARTRSLGVIFRFDISSPLIDCIQRQSAFNSADPIQCMNFKSIKNLFGISLSASFRVEVLWMWLEAFISAKSTWLSLQLIIKIVVKSADFDCYGRLSTKKPSWSSVLNRLGRRPRLAWWASLVAGGPRLVQAWIAGCSSGVTLAWPGPAWTSLI